jgi:hypothetical protein
MAKQDKEKISKAQIKKIEQILIDAGLWEDKKDSKNKK